ncbi:protein DESIGUAL 3-like [Impatiens glandulifera]|uniref:protein DESIGUAL 3-like n=1 Tax=Impatiens glandulifera TaxID=253017 RepID=UPI001FB0C415|nr:protein DESIGUAL 3-like [Impatiens glandulifera]
MLRIVGILACIMVVAMDIAAGLFAIKAQAAQDQVRELRLLIFECKEASPKVLKLGLAAAGFLGVSHVLANLIGCTALFCCSCTTHSTDHQHHSKASSSSSYTRQCSLAFLLFTWVVWGIGMFVLVTSIRDNNNSNNNKSSLMASSSCGISHHHFLSYGAISCFAHAISSVAFYVTATATTNS